MKQKIDQAAKFYFLIQFVICKILSGTAPRGKENPITGNAISSTVLASTITNTHILMNWYASFKN